MVVLEKNLFEIPETEISETNILMTIFNGKEVFRNPSFKEGEVSSENTANNEGEVSPEKKSNTSILVISGLVLMVMVGALLVVRHRLKVKQSK